MQADSQGLVSFTLLTLLQPLLTLLELTQLKVAIISIKQTSILIYADEESL